MSCEKNCGNCVYLNTSYQRETRRGMEYKCTERGSYYRPDENRGGCRYYQQKAPNDSSSNCFITTIVVNMCGFDDTNSRLLNTLRKFRGNVLQQTSDGEEYLKTYDVIGPVIAKCLETEDNKELAYRLYSEGIMPVSLAIENNEYVKATELYKNLVYRLAERYNIPTNIDGYEYDKSVTNEQKGHGRARIRKINA